LCFFPISIERVGVNCVPRRRMYALRVGDTRSAGFLLNDRHAASHCAGHELTR
jgi:hypothetical protein